MKDFKPKDVQTAMRLILRTERARLILDEGYTFSKDEELNTVYVCKPGRLFAEYQIIAGSCDCPDFCKYRDFCKHTIALYLREEEDMLMDAQAALYAEEQSNAEDTEFGCYPF